MKARPHSKNFYSLFSNSTQMATTSSATDNSGKE